LKKVPRRIRRQRGTAGTYFPKYNMSVMLSILHYIALSITPGKYPQRERAPAESLRLAQSVGKPNKKIRASEGLGGGARYVQARLGLGGDKPDAPKRPTLQAPACSGYLVDHPHDAIRIRANYHAVAIDKGGTAPVLSCKNRHSFGHNLAGHGHTCEASAVARFKGAMVWPCHPHRRVRLHRRSAEVGPNLPPTSPLSCE
jgi:hypothetical protein